MFIRNTAGDLSFQHLAFLVLGILVAIGVIALATKVFQRVGNTVDNITGDYSTGGE